jgi:voltage-gated potassium channel
MAESGEKQPHQDDRAIARTAVAAGAVALILLIVGSVGYHVLEGWPLFDAFYMTIITLSTVGYGEVRPLSTGGRVLSILLILGGVSTLGYALGATTEFIAHGGWEASRRRRRMRNKLETIENHTIVCGYGRLGRAVVEVLRQNHQRVVVVDRGSEVLDKLPRDDDLLHCIGNAQDDDVLIAAGVRRARALVAAVDSDAANVFLTLSARELNPQIVLYGKADDPKSLQKLERAGANHVFSPSTVAGHRVAWQIVQPNVTDLLDIATRRGEYELSIVEVRIGDVLRPGGTTLRETRLWGGDAVMIAAIKHVDGSVEFPPRADMLVTAEDRAVVLGKVTPSVR